MEKLSQVIRQDKKYEDATTIQVHQAILENYEDQFGDLLQQHSKLISNTLIQKLQRHFQP